MQRSLLALSIGALVSTPHAVLAQDMPSAEQMWRIIQQQQQQIEELKSKIGTDEAQQREIEELKAKVEDTDMKAEAAVEAVESGGDLGNAAWARNTQIGGYGELHYNNLNGDGGADDLDQLDFHRFVLLVNHQFSDNIRFFSELEVEHALVEGGDDSPGEVELEQAYLEFDLNDYHRAKAGVFLLPVGILNETHEPPTFYGVERNPVENKIIPSTWWAAGTGLAGELGQGLSYDVALHEGLKTSGSDDFAVRDGRQKSAKAEADDLAGTARLKYTGIAGLELAGTFQYQSDITQGEDSFTDSNNNVIQSDAEGATLFETHAVYNKGPFGLRALYARWDLQGDTPEAFGADEQYGWYIEPSFKVTPKWGLFARYNQWDNQAGDDDIDSENTQVDVGINYWPHPDVVLKADYQFQDNDDENERDGFNLGVGYQF